MGRRQARMFKQRGVRSGFEDRIREKLNAISGIRFEYEDRKYKYITLPKSHTYTPDFTFYTVDGKFLYAVEAKGLFDATNRQKLLDVRRCNPELDLRLLFQRDQVIRKGSKTRYSDWAIKNKFLFHIGEELPMSWIKEIKC